MNLFVKGARILTQDASRRQLTGNLLVEDGVITGIGDVKKPRNAQVIDGTDRLLLPGLVNTHNHLPMSLFRGYGDDLPLMEWLKTRIWPAEDKMTETDMRVGTRLAALELIAGGTTTFNDMYFFEDAIAEEADKAGLRGWAGWGMIDVGKPHGEEPNPKLKDCEASLKRWAKSPRVRTNPAPHAPHTCNAATFRRAYELADAYDTPLHTHAAETREEVYDLEKRTTMRPLAYLDQAHALGKRTVLAHCGWITKDEVRTIAKAGSAVSHNPVSNMKLATGGACPVPELLEANATVGLGTDGAASNNNLDMFATMKTAALLHKHLRWDAKVLPAQTVLDLATLGGARALRLERQIGSIEVGKRADFILLDLTSPRLRPLHDPVSQVVYAAEAGDVHTTVVDGRILKEGAKLHTLDVERILKDADQAAARLASA